MSVLWGSVSFFIFVRSKRRKSVGAFGAMPCVGQHEWTRPRFRELSNFRQKEFWTALCLEALQCRTANGCVVVCVVTLASVPVSGEFAQCRSGTGERQERCREPALNLGLHASAYHSMSFRLLLATEFGTRGSEVQILSPPPITFGFLSETCGVRIFHFSNPTEGQ
jgi:hypothetical protein